MGTASQNPTITDNQGNVYEIVYYPQVDGGSYILRKPLPKTEVEDA